MIDIHTHILPDIDDGPSTLEEAVAIARAAWEAGSRTLVATPHILNRLNSSNNATILKHYHEFRQALQDEVPELTLLLGTEIYFQPNMRDFQRYAAGTLNGTRRYMLIEFPLGDLPKEFARELQSLQRAGITPVIAHPERNVRVIDKPSLTGRFVEEGALIQMNAGSLTGLFGSTVKKLARNLLKKGWVHTLASDVHSLNHRGPDLQKAVAAAAEVVGLAAASRLVQDNPQRIIEGKPWPGSKNLDFLQGELNE